MKGSAIVLGLMLIARTIIRLFSPFYGIKQSRIEYLKKSQTTKGYLIWSGINQFLIGANLIVSLFIPDDRMFIFWIVLIVLGASGLICNKYYFDEFFSFFP